MNDLFSVFKNHLFVSLCHILQEMDKGTAYTLTEVHDQLYGEMAFHPVIEAMVSQIMTIFFQADQQWARSRLPLSLPELAPTIPEKEWLKTLLQDSGCYPFIPEGIRHKLAIVLADTEALPMPPVFDSPDLQTPSIRKALSDFQEGLLQQHHVLFYRQEAEAPWVVQPLRLEYDALTGHFSYFIHDEAKGFHRIPAQAIARISRLDTPLPKDLESRYQTFLADCQQTLVLKVSPKWNAVERCFLLFAAYEKEAIYEEEADLYTLKIQCYDFDLPSILDDIFSLGSAVILVSPANLRQQLIQRLKESYARYAD